jgi:signal transduction histidine kinase
MTEAVTAGHSAPAREPDPPDSLGSTLEDYRLALSIVAGGTLLSLLGFLWVLSAASAAAHRRLDVEMDAARSAARDALSDTARRIEQLADVMRAASPSGDDLRALSSWLALRRPLDVVVFTPAAGGSDVLIAGDAALAAETRRSDAVALVRDAAARDVRTHALLRSAEGGAKLIAFLSTPVPGEVPGTLVVRHPIEAAELRLAEGERDIELYVFDRAHPEKPIFGSAPAPWPLPGGELTADNVMRLGALARRWELPAPFEEYEAAQVTHPRVAARSIQDPSAWVALGAGLLVTALLGYIAFGEARRTRIIRMEVQSKTSALRLSNEQLEQFAVVASHDLRSPLRAIAALAASVDRDGDSRLSDNARAHLKEIQARIAKLSAMLNGLLEFARVGRREMPALLLDSGRVARETTALLDVPAGFRIHVDPEMPRIWSARPPLELVFRNLVANAIRHHDRGEGHISISGRLLGSELAEFTVADDGPGIPPEYRERIFNLFETLQPQEDAGGIGLGLAMVRKAVQMNGGAVAVADAPGRGARFVFTWSTVSRIGAEEFGVQA